jgi:hypothetical protein
MTMTTHAPERSPENAPSDVPSDASENAPSLYTRYIGAMLYFMGAALIAGAVVHYPIDPPQYTVICVVGAFVFMLGTVFNEFILATERPNLSRALALVVFSLLLSFGVGLVGGGIQHFTQFPERSALMTPIGLVMSYVAFLAKDTDGRWRHLFSLFSAGVLVTAALTWFGMSALGDAIGSSGHSHDHGTTETPVGHHPAGTDGTVIERPVEEKAPVGEELSIAPAPVGDNPAGHDHSTHAH